MYPGHWSQRTPDKAAVIHSETGQSLTFKELDDQSNQLAQLLFSRGLRRGDHIAIFMENQLAYFVVAWAAMRSGLYITPVNRYLTAEETGYILNDCGAKAVVVSSNTSEAEHIEDHAPGCTIKLSLDGGHPGFEDFHAAITAFPAEPLREQPVGAMMPYSSGTTGQPKGIIRPLPEQRIDDDDYVNGALQTALWNFDDTTLYLSPAPLYHTAPYSFCMATLSLGGTVIMLPRFDALSALRAIENYSVSHSQWVPTMFARMLKLDAEDRGAFDLGSLKVAIHAAAPCPKQVKQQMLDWWGDVIYEYYAGSELNGLTHVTPTEWRARPGTVGKPFMGDIHICGEDGAELPVGESGLVYFEQPGASFAYHNDDEKTDGTRHPDHPNWSALGDVGYVDEDGYLFLTDRATFMIISGGVNIYPQEVEDAMVMHPKIHDVAVIGVPNEEMGEEVKAVVQLEAGIEASEEATDELMAYVRERVAHYKCPRSIDFMDELPRSEAGKLYKRQLKDLYWGDSASRIL